jgi:hypothetical protein
LAVEVDELANGLARGAVPVAVAGLPPKRASPRPWEAAFGGADSLGWLSFPALAVEASADTRTPLMARMLPSFLRQLFLLQVSTYSLRS